MRINSAEVQKKVDWEVGAIWEHRYKWKGKTKQKTIPPFYAHLHHHFIPQRLFPLLISSSTHLPFTFCYFDQKKINMARKEMRFPRYTQIHTYPVHTVFTLLFISVSFFHVSFLCALLKPSCSIKSGRLRVVLRIHPAFYKFPCLSTLFSQ